MHHYYDQTRPPGAGYWTRPPSASGTMRVSNAERAEVTDALCRHFGDGRLDEEEFNDRVARANAAKTGADLGPLLADLPRSDAFGPPVVTSPPPRYPVGILLGVLVAFTFAVGVAGSTVAFFHPHVPWFLVALVVFVLLRRQRWQHRHQHRW